MTTKYYYPNRVGNSTDLSLGMQFWKVPKGVTQIFFNMQGGSGQDYGANTGGGPAFVQGTLTVTPGEVLGFTVGWPGGRGTFGGTGLNAPGSPPAFGGGGAGGDSVNNNGGSGGGGATDIRRGPGYGLTDRVAVAAGGGCAGAYTSGNGGVGGLLTASGGNCASVNGGQGGTQIAGGTAGAFGVNGALGIGGDGCHNTGAGSGGFVPYGGGGGGGGYYGGGGGGNDAGTGNNEGGGGGGSSWVNTSLVSGASSLVSTKINATDIFGFLIIQYDIIPNITPQFPVSNQTILLSSPYTFKALYFDRDNNNHSATNFRYRAVGAATWNTTNNVNTTSLASGSVISWTLTATLTAGTAYEWQVQCKDTGGFLTDWSPSSYFIPSNTPASQPSRGTGGIELEVWDRLTQTFISNVPTRLNPTYTEELGAGAGSFSLFLDDPLLKTYPTLIQFRNVVRVKVNGSYIGFWVMLKLTPTIISTDEYVGRAVIVSGMGGKGAWLPDAAVYPETNPAIDQALVLYGDGNGNSPKSRAFGFNSFDIGSWHNDVLWTTAINQSLAGSTTPWNQPSGTGNPWTALSGWPDSNAQWLGYRNTRSSLGQGGETSYFRRSFVLDEGGDLQFWFAADDVFIAYLDGEQIATNNNWTVTKVSDIIYVAAGDHVLAIELYNGLANISQANPTGFVCVVYRPFNPTQGRNAAVQLFESTTNPVAGWSAYGTPGTTPGWSNGDILKTLVQEAQKRGVTSFSQYITLGFDEYVDSYGFPWPIYGNQWKFTVGAGYDEVVASLEAVDCDVWIDANFILQAAPKRGFDRTILYPSDTYDQVVLRDNPSYYFPMATTSGTVPTDGFGNTTGWHDTAGTTVNMYVYDPAHQTYTYAAALGSPAVLTGMVIPGSPGNGAIFTGLEIDTGIDGFGLEFWTRSISGSPGTEFQVSLGQQVGGSTIYFTLRDDLDWTTSTYVTTRQRVDLELPGIQIGSTIFDSQQSAILEANHNGTQWVITGYDDGFTTRVALYRNSVLMMTASTGNSGMKDSLLQFAVGNAFSGDTHVNLPIGEVSAYPYEMTPDMILRHFKAGIALFNPVTQPVRFSPAVNASESDSALEFRGKTSLIAASSTQSQEISASVDTGFGRIEGFYNGSNGKFNDIRRVAQASIDNLLNDSTSANTTVTGFDQTPWRDYGVGDQIMAPGDSFAIDAPLVSRRVVSISLAEDPNTRRPIYALEFDTLNQSNDQRLARWINRITPSGSLGGLIPDPLTGNS